MTTPSEPPDPLEPPPHPASRPAATKHTETVVNHRRRRFIAIADTLFHLNVIAVTSVR
ncbi:MAG TPA: hypothetical protein VHW44_20705 [Pseudonocardiaceae bacterium]|nr:hypothetical protein [Pseudonocardiaceae bacterium]